MVPLNRVSELVSPSVVIRCLQHMVFAPSISTAQASPLGVVLLNQVCLKSKDILNVFVLSIQGDPSVISLSLLGEGFKLAFRGAY